METQLKGYKFLLMKAYFDKGWGFMSQAKYFLLLGGVSEAIISSSLKLTIIAGFAYCVFCYFLGRAFYNYRWIDTENEINNIFNPFQREVREKIGIPNNRKI